MLAWPAPSNRDGEVAQRLAAGARTRQGPRALALADDLLGQERTAKVITSGGNRNPANTEGATDGAIQRAALINQA
jgi:hypothetical protein